MRRVQAEGSGDTVRGYREDRFRPSVRSPRPHRRSTARTDQWAPRAGHRSPTRRERRYRGGCSDSARRSLASSQRRSLRHRHDQPRLVPIPPPIFAITTPLIRAMSSTKPWRFAIAMCLQYRPAMRPRAAAVSRSPRRTMGETGRMWMVAVMALTPLAALARAQMHASGLECVAHAIAECVCEKEKDHHE